jgi:predicted O-linked N-acetylglucosamine transferase (SPINDLY family)
VQETGSEPLVGPSKLAAPDEEAERLINKGQPLEDAGDYEAALICYNDAIRAAPSHARARMNAGNVLARLGRWDEALAAFEKAVECSPNYAPAHFNLGSLFLSRGAHIDAESSLSKALELAPDMHDAAIMLADVYEACQRFDEAEAAFHRALEVAPHHAGAMLNFGWFCVRQGRMREALHWLQQARAREVTNAVADSEILFALNFESEFSPEEIAQEHVRVGQEIAAAAGEPFVTWRNTLDPERRLRVGYVSGDFGPHPVAFFIRPVIEGHDRTQFDVYCYANAADRSSVTQALRKGADAWRSIEKVDDTGVAEQIRRDRIDILVDLSGHTNRGRPSVFARHPAPVQVTWLGYLNTTGLPAMDYRITDRHTDPEGETEHLHVERLIRMPHSQWCYFAWHDVSTIPVPHAERPDGLMFGSFNQYAKITDATLALWSRVLRFESNWELVVFDVRHAAARDRLRDRMQRHGIDVDRVTYRGRAPIREYLGAIGNVDIALDTLPYNGATTALDVLWMGVPVVGLRGDRGIARGTYSILRTLEADDLIAKSPEEFVEINLRLAQDGAWRARLRDTLRQRLEISPLMDSRTFTSALEQRYRAMWGEWCAARRDAST